MGAIIGRATGSVNESEMENLEDYLSLAYSALAAMRMGISGSASFQRAKKS